MQKLLASTGFKVIHMPAHLPFCHCGPVEWVEWIEGVASLLLWSLVSWLCMGFVLRARKRVEPP